MTRLRMFDSAKSINRMAYLIGSLAVFIILGSILTYIAQNWFQVERVVIVGDFRRITDEELKNVAAKQLVGTMFTLNIARLQSEFRLLPWVKTVTVTREFPYSIIVKIVEYNAIARLGDRGIFVSPRGEVFYGAKIKTVLPTFYSPLDKAKEMINVLLQSQDALKEYNLFPTKLYWLSEGIVQISFSDKLQVVICGENIADKLKILSKYWVQLHQVGPQMSYINMCYKNAVAIR